MTAAKCIFVSTLLLFLTITISGQTNNERITLGKSYAKKQLMSALAGEKQHNVIDNQVLILKDSMTAVSVAEPILFSIYGKDNVIQQRPYEIYLVDNYWIILGTLPERTLGGTFLIILNAKNSETLRITHGK
jgi:hypothetical protein